ncbi:uncharacterized protein J3D65DRAFT_300544 [Phyllosticta citribraziliensis]|uniref:ubiquitinyl hydrolase 1 n=1 Tax=Phyllosticta citribraziliensis TaxID=989973 RepID=A0ABR1LYQ8_9PEZI
MALTKIKTKDLARSASLQRSRRRRRRSSIVFLSTSTNPSRFFDERIGRHPGSSTSKSTTNKHPLSTTMAEPVVSPKMDATNSPYISTPAAALQQSHHPKSPNQHSKPPAKKTRPEISLIKRKEQEASSETSESSSSSTRPPSIFDRDEVRGKSGPVVDTPPSSPASETALDSERKRVATKKERRERKRASLLQQDTTSSEKQNPTKQEKREAKKQASAQQQQQSTTSTPDLKSKTKAPVEQAQADRAPLESRKKESAKPQVSSAQKDATKPNRTAGQSLTGKKTEMADERARRRQFLDSLDRRWPNPNVGGYGLFNPGVFCYRRSVLQCLLNIPVFVTWLSTHRRNHSKHCPGEIQETVKGKPRITKATACFACALIGLAEAYWTPKGKQELLDATRYFDLTMKKIAFSTSTFPMGADSKKDFSNQQDANEFCLWMLNVLPTHNQMDTFQYRSIFGFGMSKTWACTKCRRVSRTLAEDVHMSVSIQAGQRNRLEACIERHLLHERMEGVYCENKQCSYYSKLEKGKKPEEGMTVNRRTSFTQLPEIMIIHLRRFTSRMVGKGKRAVPKNIKIDDPVIYPPVLDFSKYLASGCEDEKARYSLSGVVLQWGELSFGHYLARTVTPKGVRQISDSSVQSINFSDLLQPHDKRNRDSTPYVLFYTRLRDGDASPLAEDGASKPKPTGSSSSKTSSAKNSKQNTSKSNTAQPSKSSSLKRSDAGFQKKRKFSDAQPSPGFKKHKQNNHRSSKF